MVRIVAANVSTLLAFLHNLITAMLTRLLLDRRASDALVTHVPVLSKVLKSPALRFGNQQSSEDTAEHECTEDLHDVVEPWTWVSLGSTARAEGSDAALSDDGTDLAKPGGDAVGGGTVASGEALAGDNEGGCVGAPVEEELDKDVDTELTVCADLVEGEAPDPEEQREEAETDELEGSTSDGVEGGDSKPVSRNGTRAHKNAVTRGQVEQDLIQVGARSVTDGGKNGRRVQAQTVKSHIKQQPGHGCTEEDLAVPELAVESEEVGERGLGHIESRSRRALGVGNGDLVWVALTLLAGDVRVDVGVGLFDVPLDIKGVAGRLGNGQTVVQSNASGDDTDAWSS